MDWIGIGFGFGLGFEFGFRFGFGFGIGFGFGLLMELNLVEKRVVNRNLRELMPRSAPAANEE